ncbi:hypothetical protein [Pseudooctadecabacter sp.]|uniref:hypothetical protein n=1 Tax=Pseudooctadecabacter sp. TaxID=1966338 RepID=UPI0026009EA2|nr:hypothetical protein [Pseudooctadecabacter sp.]
MTSKLFSIALPLIAAGSMASAQEVNYLSYGGSYTNLSTDFGDIDLFGIGASIDYSNSGFIFNGSVGYIDLDDESELTRLSFRVGYEITPSIVAYAGADYLDIGFDDVTFYNIGGEYSTGLYTVGLNFEEADFDGADTLTTLYGSYQVSSALEVALAFADDGNDTVTTLGADYDMGDTELAAVYSTADGNDIFAVNGNYDFGNGFRAGGGYVNFDGEIDILQASGGYEVSDSLWVDLSVGQADIGGEDIDLLGLSLTFETGRESLLIDRAQTAQTRALGTLGELAAFGF